MKTSNHVYDYVIIGSGFGGSVSALRLAEKGYSVLILEKGKRYRDPDFATSNWQFWKYLWIPGIRAHGILEISVLKGLMVLHGVGVGGGSLGYANVLEIPSDETFATPAWNQGRPWGEVLRPHYETARRMLGVARNPRLWKADEVFATIARERGREDSFRATDVGVFFGEPKVTVPDPYFNGQGPDRAGCQHCGGCMVGCRHNAKNTLPKNYLHFAEKLGVEILAECEVTDVQPLKADQAKLNGERYEVIFQSSTRWFKKKNSVLAKNVIFSASVMGTMDLLLHLRDVTHSLPKVSLRLGEMVRTNSEALLGSISRTEEFNYSQGVAISSIFNADDMTRVEPTRYPDGSSLMRLMAAPLIDKGSVPQRVIESLRWIARNPIDFLGAAFKANWARHVTIILVMQHADNRMRLKLGRSIYTLFRKGLVSESEPGYEIHAQVKGSHDVARAFAERTNGIAMGSLGENLLNLPTTAHILGGAPIGKDANEGVVDENFEIHNYPGLYIVDGSVVPANPGVNPSLTIAALAEYAMSKVPAKNQTP